MTWFASANCGQRVMDTPFSSQTPTWVKMSTSSAIDPVTSKALYLINQDVKQPHSRSTARFKSRAPFPQARR
jgi:propanediol dehydratase small subunit